MSNDDAKYYRERAVSERALAISAGAENVAEIHEELARLYEALATQPELRPELPLAYGSGGAAEATALSVALQLCANQLEHVIADHARDAPPLKARKSVRRPRS